MTSKQKLVLYRIIFSATLMLAVFILSQMIEMHLYLETALYLISYLIIG